MKKIISIFLCLLLLLSLFACGKTDNGNTNNQSSQTGQSSKTTQQSQSGAGSASSGEGNASSPVPAEDNESNYSITIEKTVLLDDDKLKIVAESAATDKTTIYINCTYENKTADKLALDIGNSVLNGYTFSSYIKDYYGKYMPIEPNSTGSFAFNLYAHMGNTYGIKPVLNCDGLGTVGVTLLVGHFDEKGKGATDYKVGPCYFKTSDYGKENMPESVLQSYGESCEQLGLSKLLTYQAIDKPIGNVNIVGAAVYQLEDGSHIIIAEAENTGDAGKSVSFGVTKVNGYEVSMPNSISMEPGCKAIDSIKTSEISAGERMKMYGLSSIGSYSVSFDSNEDEFDVLLSFADESPVTVKQQLIEDDQFTFGYVGAGVKMLTDIVYYEDMEFVFVLDEKDDSFSGIDFEKSVIVDGKEIDGRWRNKYCSHGFISLVLNDVDPNVSHSLTFNVSYNDSNRQTVNKTIHIQN